MFSSRSCALFQAKSFDAAFVWKNFLASASFIGTLRPWSNYKNSCRFVALAQDTFCRRYQASASRNIKVSSCYANVASIHPDALDNHDGLDTTHFGFKTVPKEQKVDQVYEVFKKVADKYDLMNDVMSAGVHRLWKDEFVRTMAPLPGTKLLDVAGGTGDIAFRFLKYVHTLRNKNMAPGTHVTVCDINDRMLKVGEERAYKEGLVSGISWLQGDAESLPVGDNSYDAYTIAFGIRNCTNVKKVLSEAYRILKPGGRFMCLEFSRVRNSFLRMAYDQYSFQVIPVMGHVIAQDWHSYQYLVESIRKFPDQETFAECIHEAGFKDVNVTDMTFGVVAIHSGFKY